MSFLTLVAVLTLATCIAGRQDNFADYDFQDSIPSRPPSQPSKPIFRHSSVGGGSNANLPRPTPVPILKQINRHNDDGSYTYGYEGADGSFKIETKLTTGEVMGKYGYVDDTGKLRVVDYGANKYGFQPAGEGITVAPPTLVDESTRRNAKGEVTFAEYDDGSYFEPQAPVRPAPRQQKRPKPVARPPPPVQQYYEEEEEFSQPIARPPPQPRPSSSGPVPPRPVIPGAAPVGPVYRAPQTFTPSPSFQPREHAPPRRASGGSGSVLDQLSQQYALPQGSGRALHDISFGSYSSQTHY